MTWRAWLRSSSLAMCAALLLPLPALAGEAAGRVPLPVIAVDGSTHCIEPPAVMRRIHPDLLRHQRDRTVREGERGAKVSLAACVECHAGPGTGAAAGSVTARGAGFCETCHAYVAVQLDCFECHRSRPERALVAGRP